MGLTCGVAVSMRLPAGTEQKWGGMGRRWQPVARARTEPLRHLVNELRAFLAGTNLTATKLGQLVADKDPSGKRWSKRS